ncbi:putative WD repeat-containing protein [Fusarium oxysporum f. sp. rapae]|uniref:Putative WD repeat-containing protein n=1 Tax=Fusarium oxysporum f. sp. rapae TaxID=485398 RepID=A0A8J5PDC9_FUSOX|nr:putative WD repeat-containing protein [Fusarium oxysporum f. sp. rapae]
MYNRDSRIMRKLLGKAATETPAGDSANLSITSAPASTISASFRPPKSQDAVYRAGVPILALDVSPDRRAAVLAGGHILKTVVLDDPHNFNFNFREGVDLRAAITAQPAGLKGNQAADQLSIRDVKWHGGSTIFTACANGKIFAYDVARIGSGTAEPLEYMQMQEDSRQVNTLDVNPHLKSWLLSGSQDGMARVFDTAAPLQGRSGGITFRQRFAPLKCIDSVRQVKWSPKVGHEMACCTEGGVVLKWDVRQPARPLLRINAHEKACASIAWHPDGNHLISAGRDTKLHVWDLSSSADKRQKPKWSVTTPAPIWTIAWRPGLWSATAQNKRVAQIAVSYDDSSSRRYGTSAVHIWDLARPTMAYKEIERFDASPAALLWQDQDMLWTVGQDGLFAQNDVAYAPKVIDRQSTSSMAFSPKGDVMMFLDERSHQSSRPRPPVTHHAEIVPRGPYGSSPNAPMLSISRSDSEEDVVGSFLGPRRRMSRRKAGRSTNLSTTPPSGSGLDDNKPFLALDQAINITGVFKTQQTMAFGRLPAVKTTQIYQYLSGLYLETLHQELPYVKDGKPLNERVGVILEHYARAAESVSYFRLAQTWRVLAYMVGLLLDRRAQYHLDIRLGRFQRVKIEERKGSGMLKPVDFYTASRTPGDETPRRPSGKSGLGSRSLSTRSLLAMGFESTSNVPTPLARPADAPDNSKEHAQQVGKKLAAVTEPDELSLGPGINDSTEGYDFYDAEVLLKALDVPPPKKKEPLSLDSTIPEVQRVTRHDSDESFAQMFSTSDATKKPSASTPRGTGPWRSSLARHASDMEKDNEYPSRIRGEEVHVDTPTDSPQPRPHSKKPPTDSPEDVFLISQTTMGTDDSFPSQTSEPLQSEPSPPKIVAESLPAKEDSPQPTALVPASHPNRSSSPAKDLFPAQKDLRPHIVETDFLPWEDDPLYPFPTTVSGDSPIVSPLDPYTSITEALHYESRTSAVNASAIVLLLKPLVPDFVIDHHQANAVLRQHHSRLMQMGLFIEASLLRNLCIKGWPEGLPQWGENYTAIFTPAQQNGKVSFLCSACKKPRELDPKDGPEAIWTCERCRTTMASCAVCGHREPTHAEFAPVELPAAMGSPDTWLSQWWYCPGCAHGGHASCLTAWHAVLDQPDSSGSTTFSDGCCPLDGCGHACLPGRYRGETSTARSDEIGRATVEKTRARDERGASSSRRSSPRAGMDRSVKSDGNDIPQSRATIPFPSSTTYTLEYRRQHGCLRLRVAYTQYKHNATRHSSIIVSGPSGVGKGTLIHRLKDNYPTIFSSAVSHTTRQPRPGESEGVDYFFRSPPEIHTMIMRKEFVEHTYFSGNYYGRSKKVMESLINEGLTPILDIEMEGVKAIRSSGLEARYVFLKPPSLEILEV